jgi:hypothetical protein
MRKNILCGMALILLTAGLGPAAEEVSPLVIKVKPAKLTPLKTEALAWVDAARPELARLNDEIWRAAHAAGDPWNGRSARDGIELTDVGLNFLCEHLQPTARKKGREYKSPLPADLQPRIVPRKEGKS